MNDIEIVATFDTPHTARSVTKLLNTWFSWVMEGSSDETEEISQEFDDFGLSFDDYALDRDTDTDWSEIPEADIKGTEVIVRLDGKGGIDTIRALLEAVGSYEVTIFGEEE
jgi:hypothetical protein